METNQKWSRQSKILAQDGSDSDCFGNGLSLFIDSAIVGAYGDNTLSGTHANIHRHVIKYVEYLWLNFLILFV
jgi:hypothetical protein